MVLNHSNLSQAQLYYSFKNDNLFQLAAFCPVFHWVEKVTMIQALTPSHSTVNSSNLFDPSSSAVEGTEAQQS